MPLFQHSLLYGLILSVLLLAVIVASALLQRASRPASQPPLSPPKSDPQRQRKALAIPVLLVMVGTLAAAVFTLPSTGLVPTFGTVFLCAFLVAFVFNLFDLLVIDWLLVVAWHPSWFIPPGTQGDAANRDIRFHFKGFLKGIGFSLFAGLAAAAVNSLITGRW